MCIVDLCPAHSSRILYCWRVIYVRFVRVTCLALYIFLNQAPKQHRMFEYNRLELQWRKFICLIGWSWRYCGSRLHGRWLYCRWMVDLCPAHTSIILHFCCRIISIRFVRVNYEINYQHYHFISNIYDLQDKRSCSIG